MRSAGNALGEMALASAGRLRVSAARNTLKSIFRLGIGSSFRAWTEAEILAKYGANAEAIIAAATRTNRGLNALGAAAAGVGAYMVGSAGSGCGCGQ
jgi:hypothetical protein